ncbi:MAG: hypothetical protein V3V78_05035 [Candidatus Woesearchaeota archaeon]
MAKLKQVIKCVYDDFKSLYEDLSNRRFDIMEIREDSLIAKLTESNENLPEQSEIEAEITLEKGNWVLAVDDSFFITRSILEIKKSSYDMWSLLINSYINGRSCGCSSEGIKPDKEGKERTKKRIESYKEKGCDVVIKDPHQYLK